MKSRIISATTSEDLFISLKYTKNVQKSNKNCFDTLKRFSHAKKVDDRLGSSKPFLFVVPGERAVIG